MIIIPSVTIMVMIIVTISTMMIMVIRTMTKKLMISVMNNGSFFFLVFA